MPKLDLCLAGLGSSQAPNLFKPTSKAQNHLEHFWASQNIELKIPAWDLFSFLGPGHQAVHSSWSIDSPRFSCFMIPSLFLFLSKLLSYVTRI